METQSLETQSSQQGQQSQGTTQQANGSILGNAGAPTPGDQGSKSGTLNEGEVFVNNHQGFQLKEGWQTHLPDDLKDHPSLKNFKDLVPLVKSYVNAQGMVGKDKVPVISEYSTHEEKVAAYRKLGGVPEKLEDFKVENPNKTPTEMDTKYFSAYKEQAHKLGLSEWQAGELIKWNTEQMGQFETQMQESNQASYEKTKQELMMEWGPAYEANAKKALLAAKHFGGEDLLQYFQKTGLDNNKELIKTFERVGALLSEDQIKGAGIEQVQSKETLQEKLAAARSSDAYKKFIHPNHQKAVDQVVELTTKLKEYEIAAQKNKAKQF